MARSLQLFLIHFFATVFMTGVIWVIQVVHYPLFARVGPETYVQYQREHEQRITWIVGPMMLLELGTALLLVRYPPAGIPRASMVWNLGLLAAIWLSTAFLQVPQHQRLEHGFDAAAIHALVNTNWVRTLSWSARAFLLLFWLFRSLR